MLRRSTVIAAALSTLLAGSSFAQESAGPRVTAVIHAGRVLADPASGRVLTEQSILVGDNGRVIGVEPGYVTRDGAAVVDQRNRFVLPGLIDSHVHITHELGPNHLLDEVQNTASDAALHGAGYARTTLMAGFTTVADLGAPNDANGNLSTIASERCEQAIRAYWQNPGYKILLTGGYGRHFNVTDKPHAYYTKCFLVAYGIPTSSFDILRFYIKGLHGLNLITEKLYPQRIL